MLSNLETWLKTTGLKVAEECFVKKPPALPYIIFTDDTTVGGADSLNCISDRAISIELYSAKIDHTSESLIENLLNEKSISYKRDRMWIDSESFFETTYDFDLTEKP